MKKYNIRDVEDPQRKYVPSSIDPTYYASYSEQYPTKALLTEESNLIFDLNMIYHLIFALCQHNFKPPFVKQSRYRKPHLHITPLGRSLLRFLERVPELGNIFPHHELQPMAEEAIRIASVFKPRISPDDMRHAFGEMIDIVVEDYNKLANQMRQTARSNGMQEKVKSFRRNGTRNYKQLFAVMRQRQEQHKEILLVRLDWSPIKKDPLVPVEKISHDEFLAVFDEVSKSRKMMVKHLRKTFKKELLFYAWKIEWGRLKGFHIHWIIGVNGTKYQDRINIPFHIAKSWDETLFDNKSHTHNINALPTREAIGLKVVHYADPNSAYYFGHHADYLSKVDYTMRLRIPDGRHAFGCSKLKNTSKNKTGPKRYYEIPDFDIHAVRGTQGGKQQKAQK